MFNSVIFTAVIMDLVLGDPEWPYHPIRVIGRFINLGENFFRHLWYKNLKFAGALLTITTVSSVFLLTFVIVKITQKINPALGFVTEAVIIYFSLAIHSLAREGFIIARYLKDNKESLARKRIRMIVSRNMFKENENGIIRATIETLTENISDGVIAPLLCAMIGGAPLAMAYKAVNTLDSMIGYKNEKYINFGWFAARLDDVVNYLPARITGLLIVLVSIFTFRNPWQAIKSWYQDAQKGPSPNGGIPIVTFAGAIDITLGGDCYDKKGNLIRIPYVGGKRKQLKVDDIYWAILFIYLTTGLLLALFFLSPTK